MDRLLNAWISALCKVMKGVNEMINDSVLQWSGLIESMGNDGELVEKVSQFKYQRHTVSSNDETEVELIGEWWEDLVTRGEAEVYPLLSDLGY